ncbi:MAG: hypothetical protein AB7P69_12455 [Candidatus Binatia bacterium]
MPSISEGALTFQFPNDWQATKFDEWSFYRNQFQSVCGGAKAIDMLAIDPNHCLWAIEVKDYRQHPRAKTLDLMDEVACKVRDSLAALVAARVNANDAGEQELSGMALACSRIRVVLHLEQPAQHSKLFPRAIDPAKVKQRLRQLLKAIDPHPEVVEIGRLENVAWSVT